MSVAISGPLADINELQILNAFEMDAVPRQQRQIVGQGNPGYQAIAHTDRLACMIEFSAHLRRPFGSDPIQWQDC